MTHYIGTIDEDFKYVDVCDKRLCPEGDTPHGVGGVAILYQNTLPALSISKLRLCTLQIHLCRTSNEVSANLLTIIGCYLPSSKHPVDEYSSLSYFSGQLCYNFIYIYIVGGNLNAHLGTLAGSTCSGSPNDRGSLIKTLIDKTYLHVVSKSCIAKGL